VDTLHTLVAGLPPTVLCKSGGQVVLATDI
jgi:hypothetical protein